MCQSSTLVESTWMKRPTLHIFEVQLTQFRFKLKEGGNESAWMLKMLMQFNLKNFSPLLSLRKFPLDDH